MREVFGNGTRLTYDTTKSLGFNKTLSIVQMIAII